jgi:hypothetical protein
MTEKFNDQPPTSSISEVLGGLRETSAWQEHIYKDIHAHPELSFQESEPRITRICANRFTQIRVIRG